MAGSLFPKLEGIQAVVFDAYGTLFNVGGPVEKLSGTIGERSPEFAATWRQKQLEYSWLRSLVGVHVDFWEVTRQALDFTLEAFQISELGLADELMTLYLKLDAFEDVAATLASLRAKNKRLAILSNGSPSMLDSILRHNGLEKASRRCSRWKKLASTSPRAGLTAWSCRGFTLPMLHLCVLYRPMVGTPMPQHCSDFKR
jgi:2-haloacid dehalogenase